MLDGKASILAAHNAIGIGNFLALIPRSRLRRLHREDFLFDCLQDAGIPYGVLKILPIPIPAAVRYEATDDSLLESMLLELAYSFRSEDPIV